ncbi:MAG: FtsX-like permease family protein [Deltaproteobacteria bacterium]|nr:FtsX-like permease family protein [Deltaproteobacteria bacterium]
MREVTWANWFGGIDPKDARNFFPQFGVDAETYFKIYRDEMIITEASETPVPVEVPEGLDPKLAAFMNERTAAVVGDKLMEKMGWKVGQTFTLNGTIYPGEWPFTIRAVYHPTNKSFGDEAVFFHWDYLYEKSGRMANAGWYALDLSEPDRAAELCRAVDAMFENSAAQTRTETERAFQASFVSMYGNIPFVLRVIGSAVVFAILMIAANTMVMAVRERMGEIGTLKTLGFSEGTIFGLILGEAAILTLGGGVGGALLSKFLIEWSGFNGGGMLPPMSVYWSTVAWGVGIAGFIGAVSGVVPAVQASRMSIVDALRHVE